MNILHSIRHENNTKPALIIMHGLFGQADNWNTLGKNWSDDYDVHLLDLRNHGRSFHETEMDFSLMAEDILNYLQNNEIEHTHLLGHSLGGKVAMEFAALYGKHLLSLAVIDIAPKAYPPHHQGIIKALESVPVTQLEKRSEAEEVLKQYIPDMPTRQFLLKNLYRKEKSVFDWRFNLEVIAKTYEKLVGKNHNTSAYEGKTLFVAGGKSHYIESEDEVGILQQFPKAKIETIPQANHWVHATAPKEFSELMLKFWNS